MRRIIGNAKLEENEALEAEASALADILGEVQLSTQELCKRRNLCSNVQRSMVRDTRGEYGICSAETCEWQALVKIACASIHE